jgi:hypothetical protein
MNSSISFSIRALCTIFPFILLFALEACSGSTGDKINRDTMVKIYADILIISSEYEDREESDGYFEQLDSVLAIHGIDRKTFESTLEHYQLDPFRWKELIDLVIRDLEARRDQAADSSDSRSSSRFPIPGEEK